MAALVRLKHDPDLRRSMCAVAQTRSGESTAESVREQWIQLLREQIVPAFESWQTSSIQRILHIISRPMTRIEVRLLP